MYWGTVWEETHDDKICVSTSIGVNTLEKASSSICVEFFLFLFLGEFSATFRRLARVQLCPLDELNMLLQAVCPLTSSRSWHWFITLKYFSLFRWRFLPNIEPGFSNGMAFKCSIELCAWGAVNEMGSIFLVLYVLSDYMLLLDDDGWITGFMFETN